LNKPEYNLSNNDIEMSKPHCMKFKTTRPPSNPLNPAYKLAVVEYMPPAPLKFIRDGITNADIEGAMPLVKKHYKTRDVLSVKDIDGAKAKDPYMRLKTHYDGFNYDDVTKGRF
jgi:hypothetical protein